MRRGRLDVTPANALVPRSFKIHLIVSDHPTDITLKSSLFLVVEMRYLFRENDVFSSSKVEKSKTDGNLSSTVTAS